MLRVRVCKTHEVSPGETKSFVASGVDVPILVANIDGRFLATTSMCPHEDVSLLDGERDGTRIICPGHAYEFDLLTGRCSHDPELELRRYKVTIADDELYVDLL